jgi:hypothetical protein
MIRTASRRIQTNKAEFSGIIFLASHYRVRLSRVIAGYLYGYISFGGHLPKVIFWVLLTRLDRESKYS